MIKMIIVDSDKKIVEKIKNQITGISMNYDIDVSIDSFSKYNDKLKSEIENQDSLKVYILAIELHGDISGIDIAKKIREDDWESEIIFVTKHNKMFETVFRTVPDVFDFIEKFHDFDKKLKFDIEKIFKKNFDYKMLKIKSKNINIRIYYRSILYIYRDTTTRKLNVVTKNNTYIVNLSIQEMLELLDERFIIVHRACIVNSSYVSQLDWNDNSFVLETGEKINLLSKKYKKEIEEIC